MDITHVGANASPYASKTSQPRGAAVAPLSQDTGDTVHIRPAGASSLGASASETDVAAYNGVLNSAQTTPNAVADAHSGLTPDRVNRLLGLLE